MLNGDDDEPDDDLTRVTLPALAWAEVAVALQRYIRTESAPRSRRDALAALQEIDRVMRGADEPAPQDDLMGLDDE